MLNKWSAGLSEPLALEEIKALPSGMEIEILWSGGNGPWRYRIAQLGGMPFAISLLEWDRLNGDLAVIQHYFFMSGRDPISFVGSRSPFTVVRIVSR